MFPHGLAGNIRAEHRGADGGGLRVEPVASATFQFAAGYALWMRCGQLFSCSSIDCVSCTKGRASAGGGEV